MTREQEVINTLDHVVHPSFGMSIVALNMVRSVCVTPSGIQVEMVMNCPGCPAGKVTLAHAHRLLRPLLTETQNLEIVLRHESWRAPWEF
ncbi:MAG: iron-sulfur cluster assembly protein [Candidatus Promineifilaceae bacterium]|nr:iron-sulfur cluster assembly protein [Candidatus Promineifilaceae bacterium]